MFKMVKTEILRRKHFKISLLCEGNQVKISGKDLDSAGFDHSSELEGRHPSRKHSWC